MKRTGAKTIMYGVLILFFLIWMYPIYIAVTKSFAINGVGNYLDVLNNPNVHYFQVIGNSMTIALATAVIVIAVTSLAGYAFAKMHFKGKEVLYFLLLACLAVPIASVTMPMFFTVKSLHLLNTFGGVILPLVAFNSIIMLLLMRSYYEGIPDEIIEAANMDGAGSLGVYLRIMLPLSTPIIATVGVLTFVYSWNEYLIPLLFIRDEANYTVTIAATYFMDSRNQSPEQIAQLYAALILMTIPSVIVYLLSQRYLQAGITAGSVKS
jgi:raffinose/stachyose/melibiose transport system permease protein